MMKLMENFRANLKRARRKMDITQAVLAARSTVPQPDISKYESGAMSNPTLRTIESLALALNLGDTPWALLQPPVKKK